MAGPAILASSPPWWMAQPLLGPLPGRIPPRGAAQADLMVLVPMPEATDTDRLLSGKEGALVSAMLRAMGIAGDAAYIASALPAHQPLPDWAGFAQAGLGEILLHHIALAAPRRVIVLGSDLLPLLGLEKRQGVREVPVSGGTVELLSSYAPEYLLANAKARASLWRRWLEWTVET
jgi:uracil-DNA glycosylase